MGPVSVFLFHPLGSAALCSSISALLAPSPAPVPPTVPRSLQASPLSVSALSLPLPPLCRSPWSLSPQHGRG